MIDIASALRLYLVADPAQCEEPLLPAVEAALRGGVTCVQLRAKSLTDRERVELGRAVVELTAAHGVPLLVNDRVDVAVAIRAAGVHLGVHDLAPANARRIAPPGFIVGYSPDGPADSAGADADYLGIGPVHGTASKADAGEALGIEAFRRRVVSTPLPVVGIGGIDETSAAGVIAAGAAGVAVISAILRRPDPEAAARAIRQAIEAAS